MLLLDVQYSEKDEVKALGAKWNPALKKWYVKDRYDYYKFAKWIMPYGNIIVCNNLYVIEGHQQCFKCKQQTRVIGYGLESFLDLDYDGEDIEYEWNNEEIRITEIFENDTAALEPILSYLQEHYNYKKRYSQTTKQALFNNCCDKCDMLQGRFYIFHEVDSPFFITSIDMAKELNLYKIPLQYDIIIHANPTYSSNDHLIKEYATTQTLSINFT